MSISPQEIELVRKTWAMVSGDLDAVAALFYQNLFSANPTFPKTLFRGVDMKTQGKRLMAMIGGGVKLLDDLPNLVPILQASGLRHVGYGCTKDQYNNVGAAFLKTLEQGLKDAFTPEVKAAWTKYYGLASSVMIGAENLPGSAAEREKAAIRRRNWLVMDSWEVARKDENLAATFYKNLFAANPTFPSTAFKGVNMAEQGKKLVAMIDSAVKLLNRPEDLIPALKALGVRHIQYGTKPEHYPAVGAALIKTLKSACGESVFTSEVEAEWARVYDFMTKTMLEACDEHQRKQQGFMWKPLALFAATVAVLLLL
jgi:hemoglobin-like flavoprotein